MNEIQKWLSDRNNRGKLYLGECLPLPSSGTSGEYALALYHRDALNRFHAESSVRCMPGAIYASWTGLTSPITLKLEQVESISPK